MLQKASIVDLSLVDGDYCDDLMFLLKFGDVLHLNFLFLLQQFAELSLLNIKIGRGSCARIEILNDQI